MGRDLFTAVIGYFCYITKLIKCSALRQRFIMRSLCCLGISGGGQLSKAGCSSVALLTCWSPSAGLAGTLAVSLCVVSCPVLSSVAGEHGHQCMSWLHASASVMFSPVGQSRSRMETLSLPHYRMIFKIAL